MTELVGDSPVSIANKVEPRIISRRFGRTLGNAALRLVGSEGALGRHRERTLKDLTAADANPLIVQVGANDGSFHDPLRSVLTSRQNVEAILIEPQHSPFTKLQELYAENSNITCLRAAIAPSVGTLTLWKARLNSSDDPFGEVIARANPKTIAMTMKAHPIRWARGYTIEAEEVPSMPLSRVYETTSIQPEAIDAFFSDAEGADMEIMAQLLDGGAQPSLIQYEQQWASAPDVADLNRRLVSMGYALRWSFRDVLATKH